MASPTPIFISYRRGSAGGHAGRLYDSMVRRLGSRQVFIDHQGIQAGAAFPDVLHEALQAAGTMVVVVTPGWATDLGDREPRLHEPDDWMRREIETALARRIPVLPVLVGHARMPPTSLLPASLHPLAERQAIDLRDTTWEEDVVRLLRALGLRAFGLGSQRAVRWGLGVAAVLLALVGGVLLWAARGPGTLDPAAIDTGSRLVSYEVPLAQQERLAQRHSAANVMLLRWFLAHERAGGTPPAELDTRWQRWIELVGSLRTSDLVHNEEKVSASTRQALGDADAAVARADFEAARRVLQHALAERASAAPGAQADRAQKSGKAQTSSGSFSDLALRLRLAKLQAVVGEDAEALAGLEAIAALPRAQGAWLPGTAASLAGQLRLEAGEPDAAGALFTRAEASRADGDSNLNWQAQLVVEHARRFEAAGAQSQALAWRQRAESLFDRAGDLSHPYARDNAKALASALERAGRAVEADELRRRYALDGK